MPESPTHLPFADRPSWTAGVFESGDAREQWIRSHPAFQAACDYGAVAAQVAVGWRYLSGGEEGSSCAVALENILHFASLIPAEIARALETLDDHSPGAADS